MGPIFTCLEHLLLNYLLHFFYLCFRLLRVCHEVCLVIYWQVGNRVNLCTLAFLAYISNYHLRYFELLFLLPPLSQLLPSIVLSSADQHA